MHFSADQDQLAKALTNASHLVQPQNTMAVLSGIQINATENGITVESTDLFNKLSIHLSAYVTEPGSVVLPASTVTDLIHRIPTATVDLQSDGITGKTTIKYGRSRTTIHGFGSERLPQFPELGDESATVILPPGTLSTFARQILFACSKEESRPILKGVSLELGDGKMVLVSTDGSRLSHAWAALPDYRGPHTKLVLPGKVLTEASRLGSSVQPITMTCTTGFVQFASDDMVLQSRLLDGEYPEYQRVIPQDYPVQIRLPITELRGSVERAQLIASKDRSNAVRIMHQIGSLQIEASAAEVGQALEQLECHSQGPEMDIMFNATFILDVLKSFVSDDVLIEFSGIQSAARFREADSSQYFHIVLPLRQLV